MAVIKARGLTEAQAPKLLTGETTAQADQFVATGNAESALVGGVPKLWETISGSCRFGVLRGGQTVRNQYLVKRQGDGLRSNTQSGACMAPGGTQAEALIRAALIDGQLAHAGWSTARRKLIEEVLLGTTEHEGAWSGDQFADYVLLGPGLVQIVNR